VKKLQEALNDRQLAFNAISAKNALLDADITVVTQQNHDAQNDIKRLQLDNAHAINQIRLEHKQEKDVRRQLSRHVLDIVILTVDNRRTEIEFYRALI
jgi:hypothetical protein